MFRYIPRSSWGIVRSALAPLFRAYSDAVDHAAKHIAGMKVLFSLRFILARGRGGGTTRMNRSIRQQIRANAASLSAPSLAPGRADSDQSRVARIIALLRQNQRKRALRLLFADPLVDIGEETVAQVAALHPLLLLRDPSSPAQATPGRC